MGINFSTYPGTLIDKLEHAASKNPTKELAIFYSGTVRFALTVSQLYRMGGRFARRLIKLGLKKRDPVVNLLPNSPERLITDVGIMMAGCVAVNGQIILSEGDDFFSAMKKAGCPLVIQGVGETFSTWKVLGACVGERIDGNTFAFSHEGAPALTKTILVTRGGSWVLDENGGEDFPRIGEYLWRDAKKIEPLLQELWDDKPDWYTHTSILDTNEAVVTLTSGSTGYSKMVPRSHKELIYMYESVAKEIAKSFPLEKYEDRPVYSDKSMGWVLGLPLELLCSLTPRVLRDKWPRVSKEDPIEAAWRHIKEENCFAVMASHIEATKLAKYVSNLRETKGEDFKAELMVTGGQPYIPKQGQLFFKFTETVCSLYGSTETYVNACAVFSQLEGEKLPNFYCGRLVDGLGLRIVDKMGNKCKTGEIGSILVRGTPLVFKGYFNRQNAEDPATQNAFTPEGFFKTQDAGCFTERGALLVHGRQNDAIMYGDAIVYPTWLEELIARHPEVESVVVVPVSDPVKFHEICACVKLLDSSFLLERQLKEYCQSLFATEGNIVPMPKYFMVTKEDFPKTPSDKPDRQKLKYTAEMKYGKTTTTTGEPWEVVDKEPQPKRCDIS